MTTTTPTPADVDRLIDEAIRIISGEDPRRLLDLGKKAHELSLAMGYRKGEAYGLVAMGFGFWLLSDHSDALEKLTRAQSIFEELGDRTGYMRSLVPLLSVQKDRGNYDQSLANNLECLKFFRDTDDVLWQCLSLLALQTLHYDVGDIEKCLHYCDETIRIAQTMEIPWIQARALVHRGTALRRHGDEEAAAQSFAESLKIFQSVENRMGEARCLTELGTFFQSRGELDEAREYHERALEIRRAIGQKQAQCTSLVHLGNLRLEQEDVPAALELLHRALELAEALDSRPRLHQAHQALARAYEIDGRYAEALAHYHKFHEVKEEVLGDEASARLKNLHTEFEVEAKEREAEIERFRNTELKETNDKLESLLNELREAQTRLVHTEKMASLGKLVAGVVHELNTPIGALQSANDVAGQCLMKLRHLLEEAGSLEELRASNDLKRIMNVLADDTRVITEASGRLSSLVKTLKSFARLDEAAVQRVDLREGIDSTLEVLEGQILEGIEIVKDYGEIPEITCKAGELNQVFLALLTNALEAMNGCGTLRVGVLREQEGDRVAVVVADTGKGIPEDRLGRLFEFDFSASPRRVKLGSSLVTANQIVREHGGTIDVQSEVGAGSRFTLRLPLHCETHWSGQ